MEYCRKKLAKTDPLNQLCILFNIVQNAFDPPFFLLGNVKKTAILEKMGFLNRASISRVLHDDNIAISFNFGVDVGFRRRC